MAKNEIVEDEQGYSWIIFPGDPAWKLISKLPPTTGYYALPRESLKTGQIVDFPKPFFYEQSIPQDLLTDDLKSIIIRHERIYQSINWLRRELKMEGQKEKAIITLNECVNNLREEGYTDLEARLAVLMLCVAATALVGESGPVNVFQNPVEEITSELRNTLEEARNSDLDKDWVL